MRIGLSSRALLSALILLLIPTALAACPTNFYAEPVSISTIESLAFYLNKAGINSSSECANLCGRTRFCRSAIYDSSDRSCGLSWTWKIDCLKTTKRFNTYDLSGANNGSMSLIACVDYCNRTAITTTPYSTSTHKNEPISNDVHENRPKHKDPSFHVDVHTLSTGQDSKKVQLITGDPDTAQFHHDTAPILKEIKDAGLDDTKPAEIITEQDRIHKTVMVIPQPLKIEELSNSTQSGLSKFESVVQEKHQNYENKSDAGGFFAVKRGKKPVQLVTISPEEFAKSTKINSPTFKTTKKVNVDEDSKNLKARDAKEKIINMSMMDMLIKEPVIVNGRMLHPKIAAKLLENELTSTTSWPKPSSANTEEGVLNTFIIEGVSTMFKEALAERQKLPMQGNSTFLPKVANNGSSIPQVCYKAIPQQLLMSLPFKILDKSLSKNECRCACAFTWQSSNTTAPKCRSFQYYEKAQRCALNSNDHSGKYDLVFDQYTEYHYISCGISTLLELLETKCGSNPSQTIISKTTQPVTTTPKPKIVTKKDPVVDNNVFEATMNFNATTPSSKGNGTESRSKIFKVVANKTEPTDIFFTRMPTTSTKVVGMVAITKEELPEAEQEENVTSLPTTITSSPLPTSKETITITPAITSSTATQSPSSSTKLASVKGKTRDCFEVIDGHMMSSTAGGLERGLTIRECECLCANSRASHKYPFQCLSATYYNYDMACILHMSNRHLMPKAFVKIPLEEANTTYLGMMCTEEKARQVLVDNSLEYGCLLPTTSSNPTTTESKVFTTPVEATTTTPSNTDACFLELPNYVLEGNSLAVETNVSVEECKCYCIDAPHRYGMDCQSVQYYYDSQTCLINKENRLTDPDRFSFDPQTGIMHSYFDYQCNSEKMILSMYVEQICEQVVEMSIKDIINPPGFSTKAQIDEKSKNDDSASSDEEVPEDVEKESSDEPDYKDGEQENTSEQEQNSTTKPNTSVEKEDNVVESNKIEPSVTPEISPTTNNTITSTENESQTSTTSEPTTESTEYPPVGPCRYSALYQTIFNGARLLKRILVTSPAQCFAACHAEGCRSANLVQYEGIMKYCELFRDSIVDFRRTDVLSFDRGAVHFDSIRCEDASPS